MNSAKTRSADSLTSVKRFSRPGGPKGHLRSLLKTLLFVVVFGAVASSSQAQTFPSFPVVFDDFAYDTGTYTGAGHPGSGDGEIFGDNDWTTLGADVESRGWHYFNLNDNCDIDDGSIEVTANGTVRITGEAGLQRLYVCNTSVPPQIEFGMTQPTGTWAVRGRLINPETLNPIRPTTQTFWLHSGHLAQYVVGTDTLSEWTEFNFEWQNHFALGPINNDPDDDVWGSGSDWAAADYGNKDPYSGSVDRTGSDAERVTYMSNGARVYEDDSDDIDDGTNTGGIPMRNPRIADSSANNFTCYRLLGTTNYTNLDPIECMEMYTESLTGSTSDPNHWVVMIIQYDGQTLKYTAAIPTYGTGFVWMERSVDINRRTQPFIPILSVFPASSTTTLADDVTMELDYFFYSPDADLSFWDINTATGSLRNQGETLVNTTGFDLNAPNPTPWQVTLEAPDPSLGGPLEFVAFPTQRESNDYRVEWRHRFICGSTTVGQTAWARRGLAYPLPAQTCNVVEVDVRVDDGHRNDAPQLTQVACRSYNYSTGASGFCGGLNKVSEDAASPALNQAVPEAYALGQNYPNPFNPSTEIIFQLPEAGSVSLVVYDVMGREVERLVDRPMEAGYHSVSWDASTLASGVYLYTITAGAFTQTRRMTLLK